VSASATDATVQSTDWKENQDGSITYSSGNFSIKYKAVFVRLEKPNAQDTATWMWHAKFTATLTSIGFGALSRSRNVKVSSAESAAYFSGITADGCPPRNTATIPDLEDYHPYLDTPTPTPTPKATPTPTATPTPVPLSLSVQAQRNDICAGGWDQSYNNGAGGYYYLSKESSNWVPRNALPDSHIVALNAQVTGGSGHYDGVSVRFHWTMPGGPNGAGLVETRSVNVNAQGMATVKIVSGDQEGATIVSAQVVDAQGNLQPQTQSVNLNIKAAQARWEYKNEQGKYVQWKGDLDDLVSNLPDLQPASLRVILTFESSPVFGHRIHWLFNKVFYKSGREVPESDYAGFGHLSGRYSTSDKSGYATATYSFGTRFGQIIFEMDDANVQVPADAPASALSAAIRLQGRPKIGRADRQYLNKGKGITVTTWVDNDRIYASQSDLENGQKFKGVTTGKGYYPAPVGEENDEMLPQTLSDIRAIMSSLGKQEGRDWWFSQGIGEDPLSSGYHLQDGFATPINSTGHSGEEPGKEAYCAATDIVLAKIGSYSYYPDRSRIVYKNMSQGALKAQREADFRPVVRALRAKGFAAWHRWVGLNSQYVENEIHLVDPAIPFLTTGNTVTVKRELRKQLKAYASTDKHGNPGIPGSSGLPVDSTADVNDRNFLKITKADLKALANRKNTIGPQLLSQYTFLGTQ